MVAKIARSKNEIEPAYKKAFDNILSFSSLEEAEQTITRLEILRRNYMQLGDKKGIGYCRQIARLGRHRAELISRNRRVNPWKRNQKQEIAVWFQIWLETPEIFADWLAMRKGTDAFKELLKSESRKSSKSGDRYASRNTNI